MANTKVTNHVIADNAITADQVSSAAITAAKLHSTLDLSSKTLTLPSAAVATTQSQSDGSTKIATTAYVDTAITNLIDSAPGTLNTLNELAAALNDDASFNTTISNSVAAKLPLAGGTMTGDLILGDNVKLEIGAASGGDLQIYHDGSNSYIKDDGTGNLFIQGGPAVVIEDTGGNNMAYFGDGGEVILYHNHTAKFETTAYGASTSGTGALKIPVGTTGQRPTAATGQLRFNSTDGRIEVYNGSEWSAVGSTGTGNHTLDTFTGDGSTTAFSLSLSPANEDALSVFINGAYQEKGDYSLSGNTLTLDTAPLSGEKISVHTIHGAVHDGTAALNQQFTGNGSTTAFTLNADPGSENNTQVYINGVYQQKTDYTVSGTTLTFDTAPSNGDIIEVNSFTVTNLGSSDQVTEGVSNLYHTSARAISAISAGNLTGLTVDTNILSVDATNDKVGIGTTSPSQRLHVDGGSALIKSSYDATGTTNVYQYFATRASGNWRNSTIGNTGNALVFGTGGTGTTHTNATERARIDSAGNFMVAQTSVNYNAVGTSISNDGILRVCRDGDLVGAFNRKSSFGPLINLYKDGTSNGTIGAYTTSRMYIGSGDTGITFAPDYDAIYPVNPSTPTSRDNAIDIGYLNVRFDDVYATNGTIQTSDQNEKNTITDSDLGLDFVKRLSPKSYKFNDKTRTHYGLIAQDVETVLDDISKSTTDFAGFIKGDVSEEKDGSSYKYGLRYNEFIAPLIKAIQELSAKVEELEGKIE